MSVKILYFAWVRERVGKPEEEIEAPAGVATIGELMTWLADRGVLSADDRRMKDAIEGLCA